jgi:predicted dehydrogenase
MFVGLIGCGLIGRKRIVSLPEDMRLLGIFDTNQEVAEDFAAEFNVKNYSSVDSLLANELINTVFISTTHDQLAVLAIRALNAGKNVFVEKPGALNYHELRSVEKVANLNHLRVHIGYNHRYHPAIIKAFEIFNSKEIGEVMFVRGRYGHGGRIGYNQEWRADRSKSGGGELIDQGTHLLELSLGFLGNLELKYSEIRTFFWEMSVEDNAFISVGNDRGNLAFLQVSCTEWKNLFSLEIYCQGGKLDISGLGGSYGVETLTFHKMLPEMGPPESTTWTFPGSDESWAREIQLFKEDLSTNSGTSNNLANALAVLKIVEEIYSGGSK